MISDFLSLPSEEQRKVLINRNSDFVGLPPQEQDKVLQTIESGKFDVGNLFQQGQITEDQPEFTTAQSIFLKVQPFVEPAAETAALIGGGIVGATAGLAGGPLAPITSPGGAVVVAGLAFAGVKQFFNFLETVLGLREPKGIIGETLEAGEEALKGAAFEAGGQIVKPAFGLVKKAVKFPFKKAALTKEGAMEKAAAIFEAQSKGTGLTQTQIDKNVIIARQLEKRIPDLKFSQGQLTNDASAIALERTLSRKSGTDLAQSQREFANQALRNYYPKQVSGVGDPTQVVAQAQRISGELRVATKEAEEVVNTEVMRLSRHMDAQTTGKTIFERLSKDKATVKAIATKLYDDIPNVKVPSFNLSQGIDDLIKAEDGIIEPKAQQMINLVRSKIGEKANPIGYQTLRKLRSRIGRLASEAGSGVNPNLEEARQLGKLTEEIEKAMTQVRGASPEIEKAFDKATSFYREEFIPRFRQGTVADVLQRGARGEQSKIALANIAKEFDSLDGIDDFIRAVGDNNTAREAMRDYYSFSLLNSAKDASTGNLVLKKANQWLAANSGKLKKLGIFDDFKSVADMQRIVENNKDLQNIFNKSVAGRVLEADVDTMVANAFRGSKNFAKTASELQDLVKGNKPAEEGLKKAFADNLMKQAETTSLDFFETGITPLDAEFTKSVAKLTKQLQKFRPAINVIYKDEPKKRFALNSIWKAYQTLGRTAKSPIGGGSDTFELFGKTIDVIAGTTAPGKWYAFKTIRDMVNRFGEQNVELYLRKAMFDPEYAATLTTLTKEITPGRISVINKLMTIAIAETSKALEPTEARKKGFKVEGVPRKRGNPNLFIPRGAFP